VQEWRRFRGCECNNLVALRVFSSLLLLGRDESAGTELATFEREGSDEIPAPTRTVALDMDRLQPVKRVDGQDPVS